MQFNIVFLHKYSMITSKFKYELWQTMNSETPKGKTTEIRFSKRLNSEYEQPMWMVYFLHKVTFSSSGTFLKSIAPQPYQTINWWSRFFLPETLYSKWLLIPRYWNYVIATARLVPGPRLPVLLQSVLGNCSCGIEAPATWRNIWHRFSEQKRTSK